MPTHQKKPVIIDREFGYIGEPPSSKGIGYPAAKSFQYLNNWAQNGQIFTYSGPPDYTMNSDVAVDSNFYIVLHGPPLTDGSQANRRLGGYLLPWRYKAQTGAEFGEYVADVQVKWTPPGDSQVDLIDIVAEFQPWTGTSTKGYGQRLNTGRANGFELGTDNFYYTPDSTNRFSYGVLYTEGICPAALGVWTMPIPNISTTNEQIQLKNFGPGRCIRGYTGDDRQSVGDLIHRMGMEDWDEDYVMNNARRCLFQWGHPVGVYTASTSYVEMFSSARYRVTSQNVMGSSSGTVDAYPAIVASATNASVSNPGYVKLSSTTGADTWEVEITGDSVALYDYSDASNDKLAIDSDATDSIKVEMKAPTGGSGELLLRTISLWEDIWF